MLATAALVAAVVLVVWAAVSGPGQVLSGEGLERVPLSQPTPTESSAAGGSGEQEEQETEPTAVSPLLRAIVRGLVLLLEVALVVAVAWLTWRAARSAWQAWDARRRRDTYAEALSGEEVVLDEHDAARDLLRGAAQRRARLVSQGEPRNAVVACWMDLEVLAQSQGVARDPAETSTDLATRCLDRTGADPRAVQVLAAAYHRARFSADPVTDDDRSRALEALDRVHASVAEQLHRGGVRT